MKHSSLRERLGTPDQKTPFVRGKEAALRGEPAPSFPTPDSSWAERLYARGYSSVPGNEVGSRKRAPAASATETALGMGGYVGSPAHREDRLMVKDLTRRFGDYGYRVTIQPADNTEATVSEFIRTLRVGLEILDEAYAEFRKMLPPEQIHERLHRRFPEPVAGVHLPSARTPKSGDEAGCSP